MYLVFVPKMTFFVFFSSFANSCKHGQWSSPVNIVCYILAFLVYLIEFILLNIVSLAISKLNCIISIIYFNK